MNFFSRVLILCLVIFPGLHAMAQNQVDVIHYNFSIELNDQNDSIKGLARIKLLNTGNPESLSFDLTGVNSKTSKGMTVVGVSFLSPIYKKVNFKQENDKV